ncbi:hypothetical protein [Edwardsiella tarda]|uniref:hypothetical protein n=1 Tax=Edwardsiella tarda TaxID=636 RepID=UPI00351C8CB6
MDIYIAKYLVVGLNCCLLMRCVAVVVIFFEIKGIVLKNQVIAQNKSKKNIVQWFGLHRIGALSRREGDERER